MVKQTAAGGAAADSVEHAVTEARETSASRMRRISDADALRRRCAQVLCPLYECIGHGVARRDRPEWRKLLDERVELERHERNVESDFCASYAVM